MLYNMSDGSLEEPESILKPGSPDVVQKPLTKVKRSETVTEEERGVLCRLRMLISLAVDSDSLLAIMKLNRIYSLFY